MSMEGQFKRETLHCFKNKKQDKWRIEILDESTFMLLETFVSMTDLVNKYELFILSLFSAIGDRRKKNLFNRIFGGWFHLSCGGVLSN